MNLEDLSTQLLFTTVPIWVERPSGVTTSATAFIYNLPVQGRDDQSIPLLVTNHHVVLDGQRAVIEFAGRKADAPDPGNPVRVEIDASMLANRTSRELDVAVIPIGPLLNQLEHERIPVFFRSVTPDLVPSADVLSDLAAMEDIVFVGYPSGLRDEHNSMPLIRRGITSTPAWSDFKGRAAFLIDAGVFPGSSGSPVFVLNQGSYPTRDGLTIGTRLLFLGVITETMIRADEGGSQVFLGLGRVSRSDAIARFVEQQAGELTAS